MIGIVIFQILAFIVVALIENFVTGSVVKYGRKNIGLYNDPGTKKPFTYFTGILGFLEILFYTACYASGAQALIIAWIGIRTIERLYGKPTVPDGSAQARGSINIFLAGNLMTLLFGIGNGSIIKYLLI